MLVVRGLQLFSQLIGCQKKSASKLICVIGSLEWILTYQSLIIFLSIISNLDN